LLYDLTAIQFWSNSVTNPIENPSVPPTDVGHVYRLFRIYIAEIEQERVQNRLAVLAQIGESERRADTADLKNQLEDDLLQVYGADDSEAFARWWSALSARQQQVEFQRYAQGRKRELQRDRAIAADAISEYMGH